MENTKKVKPIETVFAGCKFRSRLEARWGVFFNVLGVKWKYEPEGYDLGNGIWYLPDFWLPHVTSRNDLTPGVFVEIKPDTGSGLSMSESLKLELMGRIYPTYCFSGLPGPYGEMGADSGWEFADCRGYPFDNTMGFVHCEKCDHVKIEFGEGNYMYCPKCGASASSESRALMFAYRKAKQARFEHGENGGGA